LNHFSFKQIYVCCKYYPSSRYYNYIHQAKYSFHWHTTVNILLHEKN